MAPQFFRRLSIDCKDIHADWHVNGVARSELLRTHCGDSKRLQTCVQQSGMNTVAGSFRCNLGYDVHLTQDFILCRPQSLEAPEARPHIHSQAIQLFSVSLDGDFMRT